MFAAVAIRLIGSVGVAEPRMSVGASAYQDL